MRSLRNLLSIDFLFAGSIAAYNFSSYTTISPVHYGSLTNALRLAKKEAAYAAPLSSF